MNDRSNPYYLAYLREKQAKIEVEQLLEDSTRQLYEKNMLLQQQITQIQQQQQSLIQQEKLATLGTLAAGIAHEINNPLAFIISNIDTFSSYGKTLLDAVEHYPQRQFDSNALSLIKQDLPELAEETSQGLLRIKEIVKNLLFFARTDTAEVVEIQILEAVELNLTLLRPKLKHFKVKLNLMPVPTIHFNANELNQVLLNILLNAIQACDMMPNREAEIGIHLYRSDTGITLQIEDNGCGMSDVTLSKMFDAFYTTKPVGTGTGVGMSIVLEILRHGGCTIHVASVVDQGTVITLHFPLS